jgi:hypothetical protein
MRRKPDNGSKAAASSRNGRNPDFNPPSNVRDGRCEDGCECIFFAEVADDKEVAVAAEDRVKCADKPLPSGFSLWS